MTREFVDPRAPFASSRLGQVLANLGRRAIAAWRTSSCRAAAQRFANAWNRQPAPMRIRGMAIAVAVAAALQPFLIWLMPAAARPALPLFAYVMVAALAAAVALRSDLIAGAWPSSRLARWLAR